MVKERLTNFKNPLLFASLGLLSFAVIKMRDPHIPGMFPTCPSLALTGLYCTGCGSMRAMRDLTDGNIVGSLGHNILLPFAAAWLLWWFIYYTSSKLGKSIQSPPMGYKFTIGLLIVVTVFTVMRNIPGSVLAP